MTLRLTGISKSFSHIQALQDVSVEIRQGEVTAIVGDNGAGKSTLLKLMAGIHAPDRGTLSLDGQELTQLSAAQHRRCGIEMVYQDLALAKQHDVVANLFMGRELTCFGFLQRKKMAARAESDLQKLGITLPSLKVPVGNLSGGQQQAVAIARALLFDPKVLLLDEPTAALAAREVQQVLNLIRQEKERERIVILVSHRLNDVFAVADRILVMKQGRIMHDDPALKTNLTQTVERIVA